MQFIVTGYDGTDENAQARRMAIRDTHMALAKQMKDKGELLYAAALVDETDKMTGSVMIMEFDDRAALEVWLKVEPYITGDVWKTVDIKPCKVPAFLKP